MDQEQPERGADDPDRPENDAEAGKSGDSEGETGFEVLDGGSERDEMQVLREEPLDVLASDPRAAIAAALGDLMTPVQVAYLLQEVLSINKRVSVKVQCDNCAHMNRRVVEIADAKAVVSALTDLMAQGFGRPGEARLDEGTVNFRRLTNLKEDAA